MDSGANYTLNVTCEMLQTGDTCSAPTRLPGAGTYAFDTTGFADDVAAYPGGCTAAGSDFPAPGPDAVFVVEVPANQTIRVDISSDFFDILALGTSCSIATSCRDFSSINRVEDRNGGSARDYYIFVDGLGSGDAGAGQITVSFP